MVKNFWENYYRIKYKFIYDPLSQLHNDNSECIAIVTGATSGIGKEVARELTCRGYRVFIPCRDIVRGKEVAKEIGSNDYDVYYMDLSNNNSIVNFTEKFLSLDKPLDLLVNNAATLEGTVNFIYQVNYEGPVLLTELLLDSLYKNLNSRIVNVSSVAHSLAQPNPDDFYSSGDLMTVYANTKLYNILYSNKLNDRFNKHYNDKVLISPKSCSVHPGYVASNLYRSDSMSGILQTIKGGTWMAKSPEDGARSVLYACLHTIPFDGYISDMRIDNIAHFENIEELAEDLWTFTEERINQKKFLVRCSL